MKIGTDWRIENWILNDTDMGTREWREGEIDLAFGWHALCKLHFNRETCATVAMIDIEPSHPFRKWEYMMKCDIFRRAIMSIHKNECISIGESAVNERALRWRLERVLLEAQCVEMVVDGQRITGSYKLTNAFKRYLENRDLVTK